MQSVYKNNSNCVNDRSSSNKDNSNISRQVHSADSYSLKWICGCVKKVYDHEKLR